MSELSEFLQTRAICETEYQYVLFHGTPVNFNQVDISKSNTYTDFGKGFYLTSILEQAVEWAGMKRLVNTDLQSLGEIPRTYVLKFELSIEKLSKMNYKIYKGYEPDWLKKVSVCRNTRLSEQERKKAVPEYDVTIGPMADNHVGVVLSKYWKGEYKEEETLELIQFQKPNMQIAFHTEKSLKALKLIHKTLEIK